MRKLLLLLAALVPLLVACSSSPIDELLVHPNALAVKKHSDTNSREISYRIDLKYPATALDEAKFDQLRKLGWSKCSGYSEGWTSFVDASGGEGREQTVFQNNSYWFKENTLVTVSMRYYAGVTKDKRGLNTPDNTQQQVVVLENKNPGVKEKLGIACP